MLDKQYHMTGDSITESQAGWSALASVEAWFIH